MMNRRAFVVLSLVLAACSDSSTAPKNSVVGTWTLQSVNGSALPVVLAQSASGKSEVLGDIITITGAGYTESTSVRTTINGVATTQSVSDAGTYTVSGSTLTLRSSADGSTGTGTWSGDTITASTEGFTFVYTR